MRKRGLDRAGSLEPTFTHESDDPLRRKEREALRMAQVLKGLAAQRDYAAEITSREERKRSFLERRGAPMPAPRPSWAHEADRQSFNADWQAEQRAGQQSTLRAQSASAPTRAKEQARPKVEPDMRREAFKAMRSQQSQTRGMERGPSRISFARTIDL